MKRLLIILLFPTLSYCQSVGDEKVKVTITDTSDLFNKVRLALIQSDFVVKDDGNKTTLSTYPKETSPGYVVVRAEIADGIVTISGTYSTKKQNYFGTETASKNLKPIIYFKGSKGWKVLMNIANNIGQEFSYSK